MQPTKNNNKRTVKRKPRFNSKPTNDQQITKIVAPILSALEGKSDYIGTKPNDFRRFREPQVLMSELQKYHSYMRAQYLMGLVHPDIAVKEQMAVKLPSDLPIPTASIGFHTQHQFTTSTLGTFLLSWRPCFLMTSFDLTTVGATDASQLTYNNAATLTGLVGVAGNTYISTGYFPAVLTQRYRLVSAILKVTYNGSILNQAGTLVACATFDPFKCATATGGSPLSGMADIFVDRFGVFPLIQNGLWNTTSNITKDAEGLEFLYVPTDPDDHMFQRAGTFYGTQTPSAGTVAADAEGAHINYVCAGKNLPANSSCVLIDIYYNYEVIADPSSAPILRSTVDSAFQSGDRERIMQGMSSYVKTSGLIKPSSNKTSSWSDLFAKAVKMGIDYLPHILSAM